MDDGGTESSTEESSVHVDPQSCLTLAIQLMSSRSTDVAGMIDDVAAAVFVSDSAGRAVSLLLAFCREMSEPDSTHAPPPAVAASSESWAVASDWSAETDWASRA